MKELTKLSKRIKIGITKNGTHILFVVGAVGMVGTVVMAIKATPKALTLIEEKGRDISKTEKVKVTWKCYIPTAISGALSLTCLVCAHSIDTKHNAALATACALTESALKEYQSKVIETIGEKQEHAILDAIAKDKMNNNPVESKEIIITEKGNTLCYDSISGRYFKSDIEKIKRAENELNHRMLDELYISLNDLYEELGLKPIALGYELGWNVTTGKIDFYFSSQLAEDETPCLVIAYRTPPLYGYNKFG